MRSSINPALGTATASEPTETNATNASGMPQMVFVDDKGLEEQILTEDEDTANVLDTSANRLATRVDTTPTNLSIQQMQQMPPVFQDAQMHPTCYISTYHTMTKDYRGPA